MAYIEIADLNPVNFVDKNRNLPANYHWKHFDAWLAKEQLMEMESAPCYYQKYQNDDILFLQIKADFSPILVVVRALKTGSVVISHSATMVATKAGVSYFEDTIAFDNLGLTPEGYYKVEVWAGDPVQVLLESETIYIKESHEETLLFKYSNNFNDTILWETGRYFNFRVEGVLPLIDFSSNRTGYINQIQSSNTVKGKSARIFRLSVGHLGGIPKVYVDKLQEIMDQNNVDIDGKAFAAQVGVKKFDMKEINRYAWVQAEMNVMEVNNRRAKRFDSSGILEQKWTTTYVIEGALFGPIDGPSNDNSYSIDKLT